MQISYNQPELLRNVRGQTPTNPNHIILPWFELRNVAVVHRKHATSSAETAAQVVRRCLIRSDSDGTHWLIMGSRIDPGPSFSLDDEESQVQLDGPGVSGTWMGHSRSAYPLCTSSAMKSKLCLQTEFWEKWGNFWASGYDVSALWISSDYWHNLITSYNLMILHVSSSCNLQYLHILFTYIIYVI